MLPKIKNRNQYQAYFRKDSVWLPAIQSLVKRHNLKGPIQRGHRGSHIVYRVGSVWIKLMTPLFSHDMAFEVAGLKRVGKIKSNFKIPKILYRGKIQGWSYLILSNVEGERIGDCFERFRRQEQKDMAWEMARVTKKLQSCPPDPAVKRRGDWNRFILSRIKTSADHHSEKKMQKKWVRLIPQFLAQFSKEEFTIKKSVFLHADLTYDHFLVSRVKKKWRIEGVIDFADCRLGHPEYDLVATTAFLLKGRKEPLKEYLMSFGFKKTQLNPRLSEKLLAWTLLHKYSDFRNYFTDEMQKINKPSFQKLASVVYPLT